MKSASCAVPAAGKTWYSKCRPWSHSHSAHMKLPGAQLRAAARGSLLTASGFPSALPFSIQKIFMLSAVLLYTSYTDIPNHSAAIPDLFRLDPFSIVHAGIAWERWGVWREFFQCSVEHACAIWASESIWFNSKIKDWKIEPNDRINLCGKHTSVIIFVLISRLQLHSNTHDFILIWRLIILLILHNLINLEMKLSEFLFFFLIRHHVRSTSCRAPQC